MFFHGTRLLIGDQGTEPSMSDDLVIAFFHGNVRKENCDVIHFFLHLRALALIKNVLAISVNFKIHTAAEQIDPKEIMVLFNKSQKTEQIVQLNRKY